jgi:putative zinc finger/helix-turn-helix YgiT family protein
MNSLSEMHAREGLQCPACGSTDVTTEWSDQSFPYGAGREEVLLSAHVPVRRCGNCGTEYLDEVGETSRHDAVCRFLGILTPAEVTAVRERYAMTQAEFASVSRIGRASIVRWESGALTQSASSDNYMYLLGFPENMERLRSRSTELRAASSSSNSRKFRALSPVLKQVAERQACSFVLYAGTA